jgi:hypothetical protein
LVVSAAAGTASLNTFNINTATWAAAIVFEAPASDTITTLMYYQSTMGAVSANGYKIGLQGINTAGNPDGTYLAGGNGFAQFQPGAGDNGKAVAVSLGANTVALTAGDKVAIVITTGSGYTASDALTVGTGPTFAVRPGFGVSQTFNGSWTKSLIIEGAALGMRSASTSYGWPISAVATANAFGSTTEVGMLFSLPTNVCATYKVLGARVIMQTPGASTSSYVIAKIYSGPTASSPTEIQTSANTINNYFNTTGSAQRACMFDFTALATLTAGTVYAIGISTTTASACNLYSMTQIAAGDFDAWPGQQLTSYTSRTLTSFPPSADTHAFAAGTTTQRPYIELILADLTAPAGGAGGLMTHPGMDGGCRG